MLTGQTDFRSYMSCFWPVNIIKKSNDNINPKISIIQ